MREGNRRELRRTLKTVRPSGATSGVVSFSPSPVPIEKKLTDIKPFNFKEWLARFNEPGTRNIDRLGMIRVIPDIDFRGPTERVAVIRTMLMPLADKLAEDSGDPSSNLMDEYLERGVEVGKLRVTAWLTLAEHFFSSHGTMRLTAYMQCEGFVDDMLRFFRKENPARGERSNLRSISVKVASASAYSPEDDGAYESACRKRDALRERLQAALDGMTEFVKDFFITAWNYSKSVEFIDMGNESRTRSAQIQEDVSVGRRFELFEALIHIEPEWLRNLPWDKKTFVDVARHVRESGKRRTVSDVAATGSKGCVVPPMAEAARVLIRVAYDEGWSNLPGVISD